MIRKVLLLTPPYHTGIIEVTGNWPPLSLVYLAGHLRKAGFEPQIYDVMTLHHDLADIKDHISMNCPDAVLIGAFTSSIKAALDTLQIVKDVNPKLTTILGGVHATFCYNDILNTHPFVDYIVRGEGEETVVELLTAINVGQNLMEIKGLAYRGENQVVVTEERQLTENLDELVPAWDLLDWSNYTYRITNRRLGLMGGSRGCPHKCKFCSQHLFWRGIYRERSPESFIREVELLYTKYGVRMVMLADEYATYNRNRWEEILDRLIKKGLDLHFSLETRVEDILRDRDILWKYRQAGVVHVYVGVESVSQEALDLYEKDLKVNDSKLAIDLLNAADIITECSFISGHLDETAATMDKTLQTAIEFNADLAHFLLITPWPYTPLFDELKPYVIEQDYSKYHFVHPIVKPVNMTVTELWDKLINCFRVFYLNKVQQCLAMPEGHKKEYMMNSLKIMHREFFAENFGKQAISLPKEMGHELEKFIAEGMGGVKMNKERYGIDSPEVVELDKDILDFIEKGVDVEDEDTFGHLALKEFAFQFNVNPAYREYCLKQGKSPDNVLTWDEVPAIPTQAFKEAVIASFPLEEAELSLLTSGTSDPRMKGKIYRDKRSLDMIIRSNYLLTKHFIFPDVDRMKILLLVPSPKVAPAMAMAFGLGQLKDTFGTEDSMYLITPEGFNTEGLLSALKNSQESGEPVALIGATSGFVHFFNYCRDQNVSFNLPAGSRICDGGGYQGTFGSCSRDEFYEGCERYFGISRDYCCNILGMSESGTNYFDNTLREKLMGEPVGERHKVALPWTRTIVVGPRTGQRLPKGEIGLIRHYDLTNRATVFAVQTDNIGYETEKGFEIVGRAAGQLPGFGIEPTQVKDWILAGHREVAVAKEGAPHSHPCSTVADKMMMGQGPHSHPCSTVADKMMMGQGPHSHPCSTVADKMMMGQGPHSHPCSTVSDKMMMGQGPHSHLCSTVADNIIKK